MSKVNPKQNFNFVRDSCHSSDDESDSGHGSDDNESDDEEDAPEPLPSPEAQPLNHNSIRVPMLDQLFADAQNTRRRTTTSGS